jgi:4-hydroxy-3-polyprenylbenzoate decarboxylase
MPPVPAFYTHPVTAEDIANQTAARALELLGVPMPWLKRWPLPEEN